MSSATVGHAFKMSVLTPEEEQERQVQIFKVGPCQLGFNAATAQKQAINDAILLPSLVSWYE